VRFVGIDLFREGYWEHGVRFDRRFWGCPQKLGHMNVTMKEDRRNPGAVAAGTLVDEKMIEAQFGI